MAYDWDGKRARRVQLLKFGAALFITTVITTLPIVIAS